MGNNFFFNLPSTYLCFKEEKAIVTAEEDISISGMSLCHLHYGENLSGLFSLALLSSYNLYMTKYSQPQYFVSSALHHEFARMFLIRVVKVSYEFKDGNHILNSDLFYWCPWRFGWETDKEAWCFHCMLLDVEYGGSKQMLFIPARPCFASLKDSRLCVLRYIYMPLYMIKGSRVSLLYLRAFFQEGRSRSLTVLLKLKFVGK